MLAVTASEMQAMDKATIDDFGLPGRVLMENAARGATRFFLERLYRRGERGKVGVLAGRGNNGGDGFVMARCLAREGIDVTVYLLSERGRVQGDAAANLRLLDPLKIPVVELPDEQRFDAARASMRHMGYWIDALLGTGLNADVQGIFRLAIEFVNSLNRPVFAVDIPSGLQADSGRICGACLQACATATFGFAKVGHLLHPGAGLCGDLAVVDIGIPEHIATAGRVRQAIITPAGVRDILGTRAPDTHKGRTGHVLVVAGATGKTGAAAMTALSALRAGAGLVTLSVPQAVNPILEGLCIEVMTLPLADEGRGFFPDSAFDALAEAAAGKQCLALGPGLGTRETTRDLVRRIVREIDLPLVIDADGLNNLAGGLEIFKGRKASAVLTPHPGEMARLTGRSVPEIQSDRVGAARDLAGRAGVHVVLKGARTVVAEPGGMVWINLTGNPGMASGGMGDILTGLIAGLAAQGAGAAEAARAGVYLHGLAADLLAAKASRGYLATEVMDAVPEAMQRVIQKQVSLPFAML